MANPTKEEILTAAALILNSESRWCKRAAARKADGLPCSPLSDAAVQWDLHGSIIRAAKELDASNNQALHEAYLHLRSKIPSDRKNKDIDLFNDSLVYSQIPPLFS